MPNVHDQDGNTIGSISHDAGRIIARDARGVQIGTTFHTTIEAVSALHRAWRMGPPIDGPATVECDAAAIRDLWQSGKVRKPSRTLVEIEEDDLVDQIEAKLLKGGKP